MLRDLFDEFQEKLKKELEGAMYFSHVRNGHEIHFVIKNEQVIILNGTYTMDETRAIRLNCKKSLDCLELDEEGIGVYNFYEHNPFKSTSVTFILDKNLNNFTKPYNPEELKKEATRWYREYTILQEKEIKIKNLYRELSKLKKQSRKQ